MFAANSRDNNSLTHLDLQNETRNFNCYRFIREEINYEVSESMVYIFIQNNLCINTYTHLNLECYCRLARNM